MPTREDDAFDSLVEELARFAMESDPAMATSVGLHQYDHMLPDMSRRGMELKARKVEEFLKRLRAIDASRLTGFRVYDYEALARTLEYALIKLRDWPLWRMMPQGFSYGASAIFVLLLARGSVPRQHLLFALRSRVRGFAKLVEDSINAVDEPYSLWIDYVKTLAKGLPTLLEAVKALARELGDDELANLCDRATDELKKLSERLDDLSSRARPGYKPIGAELYRKLLKTMFIEEDPEHLRRIGYEEAERYRKLMEEAAREAGARSVEEALEMIRREHPSSSDEVLNEYRRAIERARKFLVENGVVELPPMERVEVVETPEYARPVLPFAAYILPEVMGVSGKGFFLVTKPLSEDMLKHHNRFDILNTVVHEAYPGHHIQLSYLRLCPSIARKLLIEPSDLVEGWAHYCEELMLELGIERSPLYRVKVYHDALWRAVRVYLDVELSTGMIGFEEAVKKLARDAYLPEEGARAEVLRYTMTPGAQLCYNYGKRKILELRKEVERILGKRFSLSLFHRMLLEEGNLPLALLAKIVVDKARKLAS